MIVAGPDAEVRLPGRVNSHEDRHLNSLLRVTEVAPRRMLTCSVALISPLLELGTSEWAL
jgi:hypothetical protein